MGALTLAGGGNLAPLWIFQTAAGFVMASNSSVAVGGTGASNVGIYFAVGSQATLGDNTSFIGNILAGTAVVFDPGAQITCGRAFTDTAAGTQVTFAGNNPATTGGTPNLVSGTCAQSTSGYNSGVLVTSTGGTVVGAGPGLTPVPEPGPVALLSAVLLAIVFLKSRKARVNSLSV